METKSESIYGGMSGGQIFDPMSWMAANQTAEIRRDVAKSEADIKEALGNGFCGVEKSIGDAECSILKTVGDAECSILKNASDTAHRNTIHLNSVERDLQNRIHETRNILTKEIGDKTELLRTQVYAFERMAAEKFCEVKTEGLKNTQAILDRLTADKLDEKNEVISSLRHDCNNGKWSSQFALQNQELAYLKQMINSVEQTQRFSSKTVQFGTGNLAGTAQTANQG